jgi:hypothetical protein
MFSIDIKCTFHSLSIAFPVSSERKLLWNHFGTTDFFNKITGLEEKNPWVPSVPKRSTYCGVSYSIRVTVPEPIYILRLFTINLNYRNYRNRLANYVKLLRKDGSEAFGFIGTDGTL